MKKTVLFYIAVILITFGLSFFDKRWANMGSMLGFWTCLELEACFGPMGSYAAYFKCCQIT